MIQELVFTSAREGLQLGKAGFCTVASTPGMAENLARLLESLSGYRHVFPAGSASAAKNPVVHAHYIARVGGQRMHILSRVADAGLDYSNRSNKLAHHIVIPNADSVDSDPIGLMQQPQQFYSEWNRDPQKLAPRSIDGRFLKPVPCRTWEAVTGDAGWAGELVEAYLKKRIAYVIIRPESPALAMIAEAIALLDVSDRWQVSFSTYFTNLPAQCECLWRFVMEDSPEALAASRSPANLVISTVQPLPPARNEYSPLAREGRSHTKSQLSIPVVERGVQTSGPDDSDLNYEVVNVRDSEARLGPPTRQEQSAPRTVKRLRAHAEERGSEKQFSKMTIAILGGVAACAVLTLLVLVAKGVLIAPPTVANLESPSSPAPAPKQTSHQDQTESKENIDRDVVKSGHKSMTNGDEPHRELAEDEAVPVPSKPPGGKSRPSKDPGNGSESQGKPDAHEVDEKGDGPGDATDESAHSTAPPKPTELTIVPVMEIDQKTGGIAIVQVSGLKETDSPSEVIKPVLVNSTDSGNELTLGEFDSAKFVYAITAAKDKTQVAGRLNWSYDNGAWRLTYIRNEEADAKSLWKYVEAYSIDIAVHAGDLYTTNAPPTKIPLKVFEPLQCDIELSTTSHGDEVAARLFNAVDNEELNATGNQIHLKLEVPEFGPSVQAEVLLTLLLMENETISVHCALTEGTVAPILKLDPRKLSFAKDVAANPNRRDVFGIASDELEDCAALVQNAGVNDISINTNEPLAVQIRRMATAFAVRRLWLRHEIVAIENEIEKNKRQDKNTPEAIAKKLDELKELENGLKGTPKILESELDAILSDLKLYGYVHLDPTSTEKRSVIICNNEKRNDEKFISDLRNKARKAIIDNWDRKATQ